MQFNLVVCYIAFFLPEGIVSSVHGVEDITSESFVHHNNLSAIKEGMRTKKNTDKTSRFFIVLEANNIEDMNARICDIKHRLKVTVVTDQNKHEGIIWN